MYIIYEGIDGSVAISVLSEEGKECIDKVVQQFRGAHPDGFYPKFSVVEKIDAPESRQFRNAWKKEGNRIVVDIGKAKEIHLNRIREERNKRLEALDREQLKVMIDAEKLKEIEKQKQVLRDIPQNYTEFNINSPEWPFEEK